MGTLKALNLACKDIDIRETAERAVVGTSLFLVGYNHRQLYEQSMGADGEQLDTYRGIGYALQKNAQNPAPGLFHPDLYLTGAFYRGFYVTVRDFMYEVDSKDSKSAELKEKYGETIFGLTDESKAQYTQNEFFNTLKRIIESRTGLKFT